MKRAECEAGGISGSFMNPRDMGCFLVLCDFRADDGAG